MPKTSIINLVTQYISTIIFVDFSERIENKDDVVEFCFFNKFCCKIGFI